MNRLDSIASVAAHRREQGDSVEDSEDRLVSVGKVGTRFSAIELRWQANTGSIHLFEIHPFDVPVSSMNAIAAAIMQANSQLAIPGFQLRKSPSGWRVMFLTFAFLDEDDTISKRVIDELFRAVRINAAAYLPQFEALAVEEPSSTTSSSSTPALASQFGRRELSLSSSQLDALRRAVERDAPGFARRVDGAAATCIEQPFFETTTIIELASPRPAPARVLFAAETPAGEMTILSGRHTAIAELSRTERPKRIDNADGASVFANLAAVWTANSELGELRISSFDELPWKSPLSDIERAQIESLRDSVAATIAAASLTSGEGGFVQRYHCLLDATLINRTVTIPATGELVIDEEIVARVPTHPGRLWSMIDGRLVPSG